MANFPGNSVSFKCKQKIMGSTGDDEFVLINNVLKEYDKMKKENKNLKT